MEILSSFALKILEKTGAKSCGYVSNGDSLPVTRLDGTPLQAGDYVLPAVNSSFPFTIGTVTFTNRRSRAEYTGSIWTAVDGTAQTTSETPLANRQESPSGASTTQSELNIEIKNKFDEKQDKSDLLKSFDDFVEGDITSYPNVDAVKKLADKKIEATRKIANITLENDITVQQIIDAIKDVARTYKNVTFDCDDNTLRDILVSCFKAGEVLSSIGTLTTEEYKLATAKAIYDFVRSNVQGTIKIKGKKATLAEIEAISDAQANDEWFCEANSHFYLYTDNGIWMDMGGGVDLTTYIQKSEIVNNLTTNDSQRPLSAAMGKELKDELDEKQDKIDLSKKGTELNTLNPHLTFTNNKINFLLDMSIANIDATLNTPITDKQADRRELMKLPTPPIDYAYPSRLRIETTKPSGYYTCEDNRHEFFDSDGAYYVDPATFAVGKTFTVNNIAIYDWGNDYYSDSQQKNKIYVAQQVVNAQNQPIVNIDGSPLVIKETNTKVNITDAQGHYEILHEDSQQDRIFVLEYSASQGYTYYGTIYDSQGNAVTGNFYKCIEVTPIIDVNYIYQSYIYNKMIEVVGSNFLVDTQGRICKVEIEDSEQCKQLNAKYNHINYFRYLSGWGGTVTVTPISNQAASDQIVATIEPHESVDPDTGNIEIDYYSVYIHGSNVLAGFNIQRAF